MISRVGRIRLCTRWRSAIVSEMIVHLTPCVRVQYIYIDPILWNKQYPPKYYNIILIERQCLRPMALKTESNYTRSGEGRGRSRCMKTGR